MQAATRSRPRVTLCHLMPYLQFDLPAVYAVEHKRRLAERAGRIYANVMQTTPRIVKVAFRELGSDNLYRCAEAAPPRPVAVIMCDIRRGRNAHGRHRCGVK